MVEQRWIQAAARGLNGRVLDLAALYYGKLDVHNRTEAVVKARSLGVLKAT